MDSKVGARKIPFYTRAGSVVAWAVMAIIVVMILRNCVNSVVYGTKTGQVEVEQFYDMGMQAGMAHQNQRPSDPAFGNPVLLKSYNKGYRDGLDIVTVGTKSSNGRPKQLPNP